MREGLFRNLFRALSFVITRNEESQAVLGALGVTTELGTDTAWTFEPLPTDYGRQALITAGWDGKTRVLAVCPVNPFWWPVKASLAKFVAKGLTGAYRDSHYRSVYFHNSGARVTAAYSQYLSAIQGAVDAFRRETGVFPVLVAMEMLDREACEHIAKGLGGVPVFSSADYDMYQLVSILRACHLMVSSRFHGIVTAMPAMVPSAGVTMDERIRNLMVERGHEDLLLTVDDPDLEHKLLEIMRRLVKDEERIRDGIGRTVARNLKVMARMGVFLEQQIERCYPEFPLTNGIKRWEAYLPPLSPTVRNVLETYAS